MMTVEQEKIRRAGYNKKWRANHPEQWKAIQRTYQTNNAEKLKVTAKAWRDRTIESRYATGKVYYAANKDALLGKSRALDLSNKTACINMYSNGEACCAWCRNARLDVLCLDHIANNGAEDRKVNTSGVIYRRLQKNDYPPGFQVLCYNCNIVKHREFVRAAREGRPARVGAEIMLD